MADAKLRNRQESTESVSSSTNTTEEYSEDDKDNEMDDLNIIKTVGTGTFGRVLLCRNKSTDEYFAMKILNLTDVIRLKQVDHVKNEKNILLEIRHPFIVNLFWCHRDDTSIYMLFEYICGGELFSYLRNSGRFSTQTANFYACEIICAIDYLHLKNIVYRDLKPENLLLDREGHLKITDFGFAKKLTDRTWTLCGTPEYLAPEIIQSKGHNKAVDWWALDDQLIVNYLRGCKYSLEKTKTKLDSLYTLKGLLPEFFTNRDPFDKEIQEILKLGPALPLPKTATPDSPRVMLFRNVADPNVFKIENIFKINVMIGDIMVQEDDQYIVGGLVLFQDMTGMTISQMTHMSPSLAKKSLTYYQDAYPTRPQQLHFFNIPSFFDTMYGMIKPFMKEKMQQRVRIHNTSRIEEMYQYIPKSILPTEYGGDAGPIQNIIDDWKKKVEDYAYWFKDDYKYVSDESKRIGNPKTASDLFGIEGSFRKLNVD